MKEQMLDAWDLHNHMLFMLFDAILPDAFQGSPSGMKRTVGSMFAHLNNIRVGWLEGSKLRELPAKLPTRTAADKEQLSKERLRSALEASAVAMRQMLDASFDDGAPKKSRPPLLSKFSYFIAHEWYHIGEINLTLTQAGFKLDEKTSYDIWSWGRWNVSPDDKE